MLLAFRVCESCLWTLDMVEWDTGLSLGLDLSMAQVGIKQTISIHTVGCH